MAKKPMLQRYCVCCGAGFLARRKTAIYCSPVCRSRDWRKVQKRKFPPKARPNKVLVTAVKVPLVVTCIECNAKIWDTSQGRNRLYCSGACKTRAWRGRKAAGIDVRSYVSFGEVAAR
jgi:hypothetical protein